MAGLNDLLGSFLGGSSGGGADVTRLVQPVMDMISKNGGLQNVIGQLQNSPIGGQVNSWLGTGANEPVAPDALADAVGQDNVASLAAESGLPIDQVKSGLSRLLPNLVDKLSPNGQVPGVDQVGDLVKQIPGSQQIQDQLGSLLGGLLGGSK